MRCIIITILFLGCLLAAVNCDESESSEQVSSITDQESETSLSISIKKYFNSYWSWLSKEQQETILSMAENGFDINDIQENVLQYYHDLKNGEKKVAARKLLQRQCMNSLNDVVDDEIVAELDNFNEFRKPSELFLAGLSIPLGSNDMICKSIFKRVYGHLRANRSDFTCIWVWTPNNGLKYDCNRYV